MNVLFLNTYLLTPTWLLRRKQSVRYPKILPWIVRRGRPSVIGLSEVFRGFCKNMKNEASRLGYHSLCESGGIIQTSGLMLLWKPTQWEFVSSTFRKFSMCSGTDCLANKGFLCVMLRSLGDGTIVSFIVTHLNANQNKSAKAFRVQIYQLRKIQEYVSKIKGPCVIMGDFNIDVRYDPDPVIREFKKIGDVDIPERPTTNKLSDDPLEILDYIFTRNLWATKTKVLGFRKGFELSDHNAVLKKISIRNPYP